MTKKTFITIIFGMVLTIFLIGIFAVAEPQSLIPKKYDNFTIVVLPDTQYYSQTTGQNFFSWQTGWVANHKEELNIKMVLHEGDIVNKWQQDYQWKRANESISRLEKGNVPYVLALGNHDGRQTPWSSTANFNKYFPLSRFEDEEYFGGSMEDNIENAYYYMKAGGEKWIIFSLEYAPRNSTLEWANDIMSKRKHKKMKAILVTHSYTYIDGTQHGSSSHAFDPHDKIIAKRKGGVNNGFEVWNKFVKKYENFVFVFSGHLTGTARQIAIGDEGNEVHEMLADYQGIARGGWGYLRIIEIDPRNNIASVKTYSPIKDYLNHTDDYLTGENNQFELNLDIGK